MTRLCVALAAALLLGGCSSGACNVPLLHSSSFITVLAPDGSEVCDAVVTVDGDTADVQPGPYDAGCVYAVDNNALGDGSHDVIAHKAGYLDAHGTIHVSGAGGVCPSGPPKGEDITLHLVAAEGGLPDAAADAGPLDASNDGP